MRSLFRSFETARVEYLLVSGQASIVYGAATFSEDVDLWVRPSARNLRRVLRCLASVGARVHKLTPPLVPRYANRGHGFHFVVPDGAIPVYLDLMGRPPRVGSFGGARRRARLLATEWGRLPIVSVEDLVEMKKTRRLSDYDVITNLAQIRLDDAENPSPALLRWAATNSFRAEERLRVLQRMGRRPRISSVRRQVARDITRLQAGDAAYWRPILAELRSLRRRGLLLPDGAPVYTLL